MPFHFHFHLFTLSRDRVRGASETAPSRPVDLDEVAARLLQVPSNRESPPRPPSPTSTASPLPPEEEYQRAYQRDLQDETEGYHKLVDDGGRPPFPLSIYKDVMENEEKYPEYHEILSYWRKGRDRCSGLIPCFSGHQWRWSTFRAVQQFAREHKFKNEWTLVKVAKEWTSFLFRHDPKYIDGTAPPTRTWEEELERRDLSYDDPARDQFGFAEYVASLKERLAEHGFTRQFQLDEDAARQDKLTTWIEYIGYEYEYIGYENWGYDQPAKCVKRYQRHHDRAWEQLVESKVLRPGETEESIGDIRTAFQRAMDREYAEKAVAAASSDVAIARNALSNPRKSSLSSHNLQTRLVEAESKLGTAEKKYNYIKRRNDLITNFIQRTRHFSLAKRDVERHSILLRWVLQQVPLIELELNPLSAEAGEGENTRKKELIVARTARLNGEQPQDMVADLGAHAEPAGHGTKRQKRDSVDDEQPSKRSRRGDRHLSASSLGKPGATITTRSTPRLSDDSGIAVISNVEEKYSNRHKVPRIPKKRVKAMQSSDGSDMTTSGEGDKGASTHDSERLEVKPVRRSARIAERQQQLNATAAIVS